MSSCNRRTLLLMPLALAACGFQPVYAPGGSGSALDGRVEVSAPDTVESFLLVQNLERQLGRSASSGRTFGLNVGVSTTTQAAAITTSNETNRYTVTGQATYSLKSNETGQIVTSGIVTDFVAFSAAGSTVSTLADERDAIERLMVILSDQIVTRLYTTPDLPA